jgi:hypothetical protein
MNGFAVAAVRMLRAGTVVVLAGLLCCAPASASSSAAAAQHVILNDVQCPSAKTCMTVGTDVTNHTHSRAFAETWNGTAWTSTQAREPAHATGSYLRSVSCPSSRVCVAVGEYDTDADPSGRPYAQTFNGHTWTITPVPRPRGTLSGLRAVSCATRRACVATGQAIHGEHNNAYSAVWNGHKWRLVRLDRPQPTTYSRIASISCTGPRSCTGAGEYKLHDSAKSRTWIETWNGRKWTHRPSPNPRSGSSGTAFEGISCPTRRSCTAVGHRDKPSNGGSFTVAEHSDGNHWKLTASRDQPGTDSSVLMDVACPSRSRCAAVGISLTSGPAGSFGTITETFSAGRWQLDTSPMPPGAIDLAPQAAAVACAGPDACMTIGNYYDSDPYGRTTPPSIPYALTFNGTAWTLAAAP